MLVGTSNKEWAPPAGKGGSTTGAQQQARPGIGEEEADRERVMLYVHRGNKCGASGR